ncbi:MAG: TetR/AcrR family transcriptional regulator [Clostridiaceae bacterium]|nr:TetR/AcrR family transcriptional regulator [Clostridiaceae bacterium]
MKKNPEITDATRNKLIQAFCLLFKEKPVSKITVKEITDLTGYNRSTFYQYFKDVFALLEYVEDEMIATGLQKISSIQLDAPDFNQQFVLSLSETLCEHDYYSVILLQTGAGSDFFKKIKARAMPFMMEHFQIANGNAKAVLAIEFYLTGMLTMLTHWLEKPDELTLEELSSLIHGIWCEGLLAQLKS